MKTLFRARSLALIVPLVLLAGCEPPPSAAPALGQLYGAAITLLCLALTAGAAQATAWLRAKLKTDAQRAVFDRTKEVLGRAADETTQTIASAAKAASADGKLTPEKGKELLKLTLAKARALLGPAHLADLASALGGASVDAYLTTMVESHLQRSAPMLIDPQMVPPPAGVAAVAIPATTGAT